MRFTETEASALLGKSVKALVDLSEVPEGTEGTIVKTERGGGGYIVGIAWTQQHSEPLVDWFTKDEYQRFLEAKDDTVSRAETACKN